MFKAISTPTIPNNHPVADLVYLVRGTLNVDKVLVTWLRELGFGEVYQYFFYTVLRDYETHYPEQDLIEQVGDFFVPSTPYSKLVAELIVKLSSSLDDNDAVTKGRGIVDYVCIILSNMSPHLLTEEAITHEQPTITPRLYHPQHGQRPRQDFVVPVDTRQAVWLAGIVSGLVEKQQTLIELLSPDTNEAISSLGSRIKRDFNLPDLVDEFSLGLLVIADNNPALADYRDLLGDYYTTAVWREHPRVIDIVEYIK